MPHTVSLLPSGDLEFVTASGRTLRIPLQIATTEVPWHEPDNDLATLWRKRAQVAEAAFLILRKILAHVEEHNEHPLAYPTQSILDAFERGKQIDWTNREPVVKRTVIGDVATPRRKAKPTLKAFGHEKRPPLDLSNIEFEL